MAPASPATPARAGDDGPSWFDEVTADTAPTGAAPVADDATSDAGPAWVTVTNRAVDLTADRAVRPRRVIAQLVLGVVAAIVVVGVLGSLAAKQLAEREAVNDAATMAGVVAETVVQPVLSDELIAGDPAAISSFDAVVRRSVLSDTIVRVKLWTPEGKVIYADEPQLIGRSFTLDTDQREALAGPTTVAEVSDLANQENAFEHADRLVEVYRPVWAPDGKLALFEIYTSYDPVGARTSQLWRGFAGVTASSLVLLVLIVAPIVWHLVRRLRAAEVQRVALLQRAVDASGDERRRIAASLHDGPVQELAATSFTVAGASATAAQAGQRGLARDLDSAAAAVRGSIRSLRTLLVDIYPASLARSGVVVALHDLAQAVRRDDLEVRVTTDTEDELALGVEGQRLVHRVAQECLRNAAKHAGPASVTVSLHREGPDAVTLDVVDDGRGFVVEEVLGDPVPGHLGTQLLADVTGVPGALLQVSSAPGRGTHWRLALGDALGAPA